MTRLVLHNPIKTFEITYKDEILATCEEEAYTILLDSLSYHVKAQDVSVFDFKEKENDNE